MIAELVYDGAEFQIPQALMPKKGKVPDNQMVGTPSERLIELAGRCCYDSLGKGRASDLYHKHLLESKHFSVHEHVHFTIDTMVTDAMGYSASPLFWAGIPDVALSVRREYNNCRIRLTANLRHCIEWPTNVVSHLGNGFDEAKALSRWKDLLMEVAHDLCPNLFPKPPDRHRLWHFCTPERDTEAHVSLFLEDSRVWSHEMVRHRHNMSQRSGRYVDETDRDLCTHPLLRDYLNELGHVRGEADEKERNASYVGPARLAKGTGDWPLFEGGTLSPQDAQDRMRFMERISNHTVASQLLYTETTDRLQAYAQAKAGLQGTDARKQARSAARYFLGNGLSTEMIFTASIRSWRNIFRQRCNPAADAAIRELMEQAREVIQWGRYGALL